LDAVPPVTPVAVTVIWFWPDFSITGPADQTVVPAATPLPPLAFAHVTCLIPPVQLAVPARPMVAAVEE
jgi:hypothetical protein